MALVFLGLAAPGVSAQEQEPSSLPTLEEAKGLIPPGTLPAVYKVRDVRFSYNSTRSIYTCSALEQRVKSIFLALGARDDIEVRVSSCNEVLLDSEFDTTLDRDRGRHWDQNRTWRRDSGWEDPYERMRDRDLRNRREQNAYVRARVLMPVEITREVMEEIKRDKSRRELISRVTRDPTAKRNDPVWFPARWRPITLSRETIGLEPEECELLDQMSTTVFKQLGLRVTNKGRRCSSFGSRISPEMTIEALVMAPVGETSLPQINLDEGDAPGSEPKDEDAESDQ
jgi:hypothetical protein